MQLTDLGYNDSLAKAMIAQGLAGFAMGRVVAEHKERYIVQTEMGECEAEITGNMRFAANSRADFPAVGDWVALTICADGFSIIHHILPRFSTIARAAVGQCGELQIIATNVDYAFLIQAVDRDFNINRLERYLTICYASQVGPIIVLTKTDLISAHRLAEIMDGISLRINNVPVIAISNATRNGFEALQMLIEKGKTYCMLGSSGVGKSTLLNNLSGKAIMRTDAISTSTHKGRHVTSHRELIVLGNGGILVDNPGMREVGIADSARGLETTFDAVFHFSKACKFKDCTHVHEIGCAVLDAVAKGDIAPGSYESYLKMEKEKNYFESSVADRRKKDRDFGKMLKNYNKSVSGERMGKNRATRDSNA
jgi:ribosome biogenesis GTPase / thiamine phosphate phosphatase